MSVFVSSGFNPRPRTRGDRHAVSANANETKPAMLPAVFVVDSNETQLMIPFGN